MKVSQPKIAQPENTREKAPERPKARSRARALDAWYRAHARPLPWRTGPADRDAGVRPDPYRVWLSEVMLQQTTVPHAAPYFLKFTQRWSRVAALATAPWEDVSAAWAGLGYYSRARNLHACAKAVAEQGGFPQTRDGLRDLPGVGPYTAAAIAAIAFDEPVAPVDGNIERVVSRLEAIGSDGAEAGWRAAKKCAAEYAQFMFEASASDVRPGDLAQAMMDLGATVCTPRNPACGICPVAKGCVARAQGDPARYPMKPDKKAQPVRHGSAFVATRGGEVLLIRRPPQGLLGGMLMPPTSTWEDAPPADPLSGAPARLSWERVGEVRHVFTHFALKLDVWRAEAPARARLEGEWIGRDAALASLPTVGRKAVRLALE